MFATARLFGLSLGVKVAGAAWGVLLARGLGAEDYGRFAFVLAVLAGVQIVSDGGVSHHLTRQVSKRGLVGSREELQGAVGVQAVLGLVGGAVAAGLTYIGPGNLGLTYAFVVGALVPLFSLAQVARGTLRGSGKTELELVLQFFGYLVMTAVLLSTLNRLSIGIALVGYALLLAPLYLWAVMFWGRNPGVGLDRAWAANSWRVFRQSLNLNLLGTFGAVFTRLDVFLLAFIVAAQSVGLYAAASQFLFAAISIASAASVALIAHFVRDGSFTYVMKWTATYLSLGMLACFAGFAFSPFVDYVFGPDYSAAGQLVRVLSLGLPAAYASTVLGKYFIAQGWDRTALGILIACVVSGSVCYIPAATAHGSLGVAWALVSILWARTVVELAIVSSRRWKAQRANAGIATPPRGGFLRVE